jgi:hypothetical protein
MAQVLQHRFRDGGDGRVVFDQKNGQCPPESVELRLRLRTGGRVDLGHRQIQLEGRTLAVHTVDAHRSAGLSHEPIHLAQSQARSLSRLFRGEERFEDVGDDFLGDTFARICDPNGNERSGCDFRKFVIGELAKLRFDRDRSSGRRGIDRIHYQIEKR